MTKDELKYLLESYWYDDQYLREKAKEIEETENLLKAYKNLNFIQENRNHDVEQMTKIMEKKKYIENILEKLNQPHKTIMYMKYITFLSFDTIAERMNYSIKRIYQLHSEAMNLLIVMIDYV